MRPGLELLLTILVVSVAFLAFAGASSSCSLSAYSDQCINSQIFSTSYSGAGGGSLSSSTSAQQSTSLIQQVLNSNLGSAQWLITCPQTPQTSEIEYFTTSPNLFGDSCLASGNPLQTEVDFTITATWSSSTPAFATAGFVVGTPSYPVAQTDISILAYSGQSQAVQYQTNSQLPIQSAISNANGGGSTSSVTLLYPNISNGYSTTSYIFGEVPSSTQAGLWTWTSKVADLSNYNTGSSSTGDTQNLQFSQGESYTCSPNNPACTECSAPASTTLPSCSGAGGICEIPTTCQGDGGTCNGGYDCSGTTSCCCAISGNLSSTTSGSTNPNTTVPACTPDPSGNPPTYCSQYGTGCTSWQWSCTYSYKYSFSGSAGSLHNVQIPVPSKNPNQYDPTDYLEVNGAYYSPFNQASLPSWGWGGAGACDSALSKGSTGGFFYFDCGPGWSLVAKDMQLVQGSNKFTVDVWSYSGSNGYPHDTACESKQYCMWASYYLSSSQGSGWDSGYANIQSASSSINQTINLNAFPYLLYNLSIPTSIGGLSPEPSYLNLSYDTYSVDHFQHSLLLDQFQLAVGSVFMSAAASQYSGQVVLKNFSPSSISLDLNPTEINKTASSTYTTSERESQTEVPMCSGCGNYTGLESLYQDELNAQFGTYNSGTIGNPIAMAASPNNHQYVMSSCDGSNCPGSLKGSYLFEMSIVPNGYYNLSNYQPGVVSSAGITNNQQWQNFWNGNGGTPGYWANSTQDQNSGLYVTNIYRIDDQYSPFWYCNFFTGDYNCNGGNVQCTITTKNIFGSSSHTSACTVLASDFTPIDITTDYNNDLFMTGVAQVNNEYQPSQKPGIFDIAVIAPQGNTQQSGTPNGNFISTIGGRNGDPSLNCFIPGPSDLAASPGGQYVYVANAITQSYCASVGVGNVLIFSTQQAFSYVGSINLSYSDTSPGYAFNLGCYLAEQGGPYHDPAVMGAYQQYFTRSDCSSNGAPIGANDTSSNHHPLAIEQYQGLIYVLDDWQFTTTVQTPQGIDSLPSSILMLRAFESSGQEVPVNPSSVQTLFAGQLQALPISATPSNTTIDSGTPVRLSADAVGGTPPYTYQWYSQPGTSAPSCTSAYVIVGQSSSQVSETPNATTTYAYLASDSAGSKQCSQGITIDVASTQRPTTQSQLNDMAAVSITTSSGSGELAQPPYGIPLSANIVTNIQSVNRGTTSFTSVSYCINPSCTEDPRSRLFNTTDGGSDAYLPMGPPISPFGALTGALGTVGLPSNSFGVSMDYNGTLYYIDHPYSYSEGGYCSVPPPSIVPGSPSPVHTCVVSDYGGTQPNPQYAILAAIKPVITNYTTLSFGAYSQYACLTDDAAYSEAQGLPTAMSDYGSLCLSDGGTAGDPTGQLGTVYSPLMMVPDPLLHQESLGSPSQAYSLSSLISSIYPNGVSCGASCYSSVSGEQSTGQISVNAKNGTKNVTITSTIPSGAIATNGTSGIGPPVTAQSTVATSAISGYLLVPYSYSYAYSQSWSPNPIPGQVSCPGGGTGCAPPASIDPSPCPPYDVSSLHSGGAQVGSTYTITSSLSGYSAAQSPAKSNLLSENVQGGYTIMESPPYNQNYYTASLSATILPPTINYNIYTNRQWAEIFVNQTVAPVVPRGNYSVPCWFGNSTGCGSYFPTGPLVVNAISYESFAQMTLTQQVGGVSYPAYSEQLAYQNSPPVSGPGCGSSCGTPYYYSAGSVFPGISTVNYTSTYNPQLLPLFNIYAAELNVDNYLLDLSRNAGGSPNVLGYNRFVYTFVDSFNNVITAPLDADIAYPVTINLNQPQVTTDATNSNQSTITITGTASYQTPQGVKYLSPGTPIFLYFDSNINYYDNSSSANAMANPQQSVICNLNGKSESQAQCYYQFAEECAFGASNPLACQAANPLYTILQPGRSAGIDGYNGMSQASVVNYQPQYNSTSSCAQPARSLLASSNPYHECNIYENATKIDPNSPPGKTVYEYCLPYYSNGDGIWTTQLGLMDVAETGADGTFNYTTTVCGQSTGSITAGYYGSPAPQPYLTTQPAIGFSANAVASNINAAQLTSTYEYNYVFAPSSASSVVSYGGLSLALGSVSVPIVLSLILVALLAGAWRRRVSKRGNHVRKLYRPRRHKY